jgi:hypothetical protein
VIGGTGAILLATVIFGWLSVNNVQFAFILIACIAGLAAITAPSYMWVAGALVVAVGMRGLVTIGALPGVATYMDIPMCWGALGAALLRGNQLSPIARRLLFFLSGFALAIVLSFLVNPSELLRPIVYVLLLGEPFALIAALLVDPPSARMRRILLGTFAALLAIQVPLALLQAARSGLGDPVQGTLYGAGAGAHTMSSFVILGVAWILATDDLSLAWRLPLAAGLMVIPVLADAKSVLIASALIFVIGALRGGMRVILARVALLLVAGLVLTSVDSKTRVIGSYLDQNQGGNAGKFLVAKIIWHDITADPASFVWGKGPAETVTRAAYLTTPFQQQASSFTALGLSPASIAVSTWYRVLGASNAIQFSFNRTSLNGPTSSAFGVLGDTGLFGLSMYLAMLGVLVIGLWRRRTALASTAIGGIAMFCALGVIYDWWEEPPFTVPLAILIALALIPTPEEEAA